MLIIAVITGALSLITGCNNHEMPAKSTTTETTHSQQELQTLVTNAMLTTGQASSYKTEFVFDSNFTMSDSNSSKTQMRSTLTGKIECDNSSDKSHITVIMSMYPSLGEESSHNTTAEIYIISDTVYLKRDDSQWKQSSYSQISDLFYTNAVEHLFDLLKLIKDFKFQGYETINGHDFYILESTPNPDSLSKWLDKYKPKPPYPVTTGPNGPNYTTTQKPLSEIFNDFTCTLYIQKTTMLIKDIAVKFAIKDNISQTTENLDVSMTIKIYDYNQPIEINLPKEISNT